MPINITIIEDKNLAHVRFEGHATATESSEAFEAYLKHPQSRPDQHNIVDLSRVTDFDPEYLKISEFHAQMDAGVALVRATPIYVHIANTPVSRRMAQLTVNALAVSPNIIVRVVDSEERALEVLGLPFKTMAQLYEAQTDTTNIIEQIKRV
jgi:hypothetical protein